MTEKFIYSLFSKEGVIKMAKGPSRPMKKRVVSMMLIICLAGFLPLSVWLGYIQIFQYDKYQQAAINQHTREIKLSAKRGSILDRAGKTLAVSATAYKVIINPRSIKSDEAKENIIKNLSEILEVTEEKVEKACNKTNTFYVELVRRIEEDKADKVRAFIAENKYSSAISVLEDPKRYYPYNNLASNLIGFVGSDNQGLAGLELLYDEYLSGVDGKVIRATDASGKETPFSYENQIDAQNGYNVKLTIDEGIQHFVEKHLEQADEDYGVTNRSCAIVMDVNTGEILAMVTKNDYDLNNPREITDEKQLLSLEGLEGEALSSKRMEILNAIWNNKCVSEAYEPGSTFKVFTSAMAIEENLVSKKDTFTCVGYKMVGGWRISCAKRTGHGTQTFREAFANSCNPAFMEIGARVGSVTFLKYVHAFGFGEKTGVKLPGEATGIFHSASAFNTVELATSSFGQTFKVTPIQLITAFSSCVNGGYLYQPNVVKEITDDAGNVIKKNDPTLIRQVISQNTSDQIRDLLGAVLEKNTYVETVLSGYKIGGKTGTSEKRDLTIEQGRQTERIASFIGVAPLDDPQIAILVMFDQPQTNIKYGSVLATPVAVKMFADILPYMGIEPTGTVDNSLSDKEVIVPNVIGMTREQAREAFDKVDLNAVFSGGDGNITYQVPAYGQKLVKGSKVLLYTEGVEDVEQVEVPDVTSMSLKDATNALEKVGLNINAVGVSDNKKSYISIRQSVEAKTLVAKGSVIVVDFIEVQYSEGDDSAFDD